MGKVFRIFKEGAETYTDWNASPDYPYDSSNRESIVDPEGATAAKEITSIPSPYARIELVKSAFKYVCRHGMTEGGTIYHKLVSETLDVGEIFFNIEKLRDAVEIIKWDPQQDIKKLKDSRHEGNRCFGDVLEKYLISDSSTYNFSKMRNMYLLNFKNGPQMLNIIGATSPATVFFSSANSFPYVTDAFVFGEHRPFGDEFEPLWRRNPEYIKAWFAFRRRVPDFAGLFPEIDSYLNLTYKSISDNALKESIIQTSGSVDEFEEIELSQGSADSVEVLGFKLFASKPHAIQDSEFEIRSDRAMTPLPLVLPVEPGNRYENLRYTSSRWGSNNVAPLSDSRKIEERTLPFDGILQPYLTLGDFLEKDIIAVPHKLNSKEYFDGNVSDAHTAANAAVSFLLPVKPMYFEYFTVSDLCGTMPDGKKALELTIMELGTVKATLRIPIRGNSNVKYMEYTRLYYNDKLSSHRNDPKTGGIVELDFTAFVMPNLSFASDAEAFYIVGLVSTDEKHASADFYMHGNALVDISHASRTKKDELTKAVTYTIEHKRFEYIRIKTGNGQEGIIVPKFKSRSFVNAFDFAVDLGTSYTHVEYKAQDSHALSPLEYSSDSIISEVFTPNYVNKGGRLMQWDLLDEQPLIEKDFVPVTLGKNTSGLSGESGDFYFPTRTVLSCARFVSWTESTTPFELTNIPFAYGKRRDLEHDKYEFNIKWGDVHQRNVLDKYIDCLMLILRNKALMNDADLSRCRVVWFYPQSMPQNQLSYLKRVWDEKFNKYFAPYPAATSYMLESVAPIKYYFNKIASSSDILNIDIGGGTTDIAFARNKNVEWATSFRFAMDDLFRDNIAKDNLSNGIIDYFKPGIRSVLQNNNLGELLAVFDSENNMRPENMASFLFSLKDNRMTSGIAKNSIDFDYIIETDDKFKIVFLLFYTSIVYHAAQIMKLKNTGFPRHISFSGNGSYIVRILSGDTKIVADYTKTLIENVMGEKCPHDIDILGVDGESNPKTVTCKGGLLSDDFNNPDFSKGVILCATGDEFVGKDDTYAMFTDEYTNKVIEASKRFFKFTFEELPAELPLDKMFGVSRESFSLARKISCMDTGTFLSKCLLDVEGGDVGKNIEETSFFYIVKGVISALSARIYNDDK